MRFELNAAVIVTAAIAFCACSAPVATPTQVAPSAPTVASPSPTLAPTSSPPATFGLEATATVPVHPIATPTPGLPATPVPVTPQVVTLATGLQGPDDLLFGPDSSLYVSDINDGTVRRIAASGQVTLVLSGLQVPEGLVLLPDGSLVIAEQKTNRLLVYDPSTNQRSTLVQMVNKTNQDGVDGIALDGTTRTLIVPDSPNGTVLRMSEDGKSATTLARGMVRPTGAAVAPDGSILVVDEYGNRLYRLPATGFSAPGLLAQLPTPDDVAVDTDGNIYVVCLGDSALHRIDPQTGKDMIVARGFASPQGLVLDGAGNPVVAEEGSGKVVKLLIH